MKETADLIQKVNLNIQNENEKFIAEAEMKKVELANKLKRLIETIEARPVDFLFSRSPCERLLRSMPFKVDLNMKGGAPFLAKDYFVKWPSFTRMLYCHLDY